MRWKKANNMGDWISSFEPHWFWLSLGVLLGAIEILIPGFFLIWMGLAAIIVGLIALIVPISLAYQIALFAILSVLTVYAGKRYFSLNPIQSDDPALNDRASRLKGEIVTVVEDIADGRGRVKLGDGEWNVRGADAPAGARVRITGADGAILLVEPV
jgi:inner membrane protein